VLVGVEVVQLEHQLTVERQHLALVAAVGALQPEDGLVPPARRGDIGHDQHRLGLHRGDANAPTLSG
jgi:hypothetical protein